MRSRRFTWPTWVCLALATAGCWGGGKAEIDGAERAAGGKPAHLGGGGGADDDASDAAAAPADGTAGTGTPAPARAGDDAGSSSMTTTCPELGVDAIACESFESSAALPARFTPIAQQGELRVAGGRAASGASSLLSAFDPLPSAGRAQLAYALPVGIAPGVSLQFSIYLPIDGYPDAMDLGGFASSSGADAFVVSVLGGDQLVLSDRTGAAAATTPLAAIPQGAWRCVEMEAKLDGTLSVWIGKTLVAQLHSQQTALLASARVGLAYAGTAGPKTSTVAYVDDVVIGTHAVGCLH